MEGIRRELPRQGRASPVSISCLHTMPGATGPEEGQRRSAPVALHNQPPRPSTSSLERRRLVEYRRSRSFSDFDFVLDDDGGDGRKKQQQKQHPSRDRRSQHQYQPRVVDVGCRGGGVGFHRWNRVPYYRLPEQQLRLTIVKLDGSSFDVQVMKSASVSELKFAVEEIFTRSLKGEGNISWSHVWGHFCLCYKGQKLIDDKVSLKTFGIRDEDELHFIRHVSITYNPIKLHPRKHGCVYDHQKIELTGSEVRKGSGEDGTDGDGIRSADDCSNSTDEHHDHYENLVRRSEFKLAHSLRGWINNSGLWFSGREIAGTTICPKI